jgi:hypothetical protein
VEHGRIQENQHAGKENKKKRNPCPPLASIPSSFPSRSSLHDDLNKKVNNTDQTATLLTTVDQKDISQPG